ncbi:RlpA-like double-psi beta-barrel-protein domain-containing protein-containing protein [Cladorrhinum sp. PSN332]|nr:RlpA-like double-psi beta-barrel-protein domain-containing protein-containing protein [Cladorrhinum sp. PSN332]
MGLIHLCLKALLPFSALISAAPAPKQLNTEIAKPDSLLLIESTAWRSPYLIEDEEEEEKGDVKEEDVESNNDDSDLHHLWDHKFLDDNINNNSISEEDDNDSSPSFSKFADYLKTHYNWDLDMDELASASASESASDWSDGDDGDYYSDDSGSGSASDSDDDSWKHKSSSTWHGRKGSPPNVYDKKKKPNYNDDYEEPLRPSWTPPGAGPMANLNLHYGIGTVYTADGKDGSCGITHGNSAMIVALSYSKMDRGYKASHCGRRVRVKNKGANYPGVGGNGNVIEVVVADTCADCEGNHIDFSHAAWDALTDYSNHGQINLEWAFID